jgi:hypothetical protein
VPRSPLTSRVRRGLTPVCSLMNDRISTVSSTDVDFVRRVDGRSAALVNGRPPIGMQYSRGVSSKPCRLVTLKCRVILDSANAADQIRQTFDAAFSLRED